MNHLSPAEFVDAADNALAPSRAAHLAACGRCRERLADVRGALAASRTDDVPEPSPLYWQHMTARVRERLTGETIESGWRASWRAWLSARTLVPVASAVAVVAAVVVAGQMVARTPERSLTGAAAPFAAPADVTVASVPSVEPENSDVWQVLTSAAAEMPIEDAHEAGMGVTSGAIDRAVQRMSPEELNELGHLLQSQLHGSGD